LGDSFRTGSAGTVGDAGTASASAGAGILSGEASGVNAHGSGKQPKTTTRWEQSATLSVRTGASAEGEATAVDPSAWPPAARQPLWPLSSTTVRYYNPATDGPVDMEQLTIHFAEGIEHYPNLSLRAISGYPIWQRTSFVTRASGGNRALASHVPTLETIVLPVDGVNGRPLLHCDSLCGAEGGADCTRVNQSTLEQVCRDPHNCRCYGDNVTDIGCANDNFGGSWLLPPLGAASGGGGGGSTDSGGGGSGPRFVWAQGRRISAFAPHAAGFDNLAQIRRLLVTWQTTDGVLSNQQCIPTAQYPRILVRRRRRRLYRMARRTCVLSLSNRERKKFSA
jgi:hypothetical protein